MDDARPRREGAKERQHGLAARTDAVEKPLFAEAGGRAVVQASAWPVFPGLRILTLVDFLRELAPPAAPPDL